MNNTKHRSPFAIAARLIVLVRPMLPIMLAAIVMGVIGHFCATFITIFGGFALLTAAGLPSPLAGVGTAFVCILVFALLRGVLRYAEQASNHYIAFKLLALIRDKVFGALRRLTPAKLEGRDRGDLISLITADIEQLEVFYAHTISPVCIAVLCSAGMVGFVAWYHPLPALVLLAGYLAVGVGIPVWAERKGEAAGREYRAALADTNSYVLESLRGLRETIQYNDTAARAAGIAAHSETLGEKQTAMKCREGLTTAVTNTIILLTARTSEEDNLEGLDTGADAYLMKPFSIELLRKTVLNLIRRREQLRNAFSGRQNQEEQISIPEVKSPDDRLMERVMRVINENLGNPALTVEMISTEVGISRVHLHRKLKELTNQTTQQLIRNLRLKQAATLLADKRHSITEVATLTGFTHPTYFATAFREMYGISPSEYMERHIGQDKTKDGIF